MRVLQVAPPWVAVPPSGYGGTEMVIAELSTALSSLGHEVLLFATGDSADRCGWVFPEALGLRTFRPAAEVYQAVAAREVAVSEGVDLIHDHTTAGTALTASIPTVFTQHNRFTEESRPLYQRAQAHGSAVVAISRSHAHEAGFDVDAVVRHGIDVSHYPMGDGIGGYALFIGRMSPDKGVHLAIGIARSAGLPLKIAAKLREASEWEYFREQVQPLLSHDIEYLGEANFVEKVELLRSARVLINPIQWSEPFGMIAIEAMACGTPVVTTELGAAPEIVVDGLTGFVAPVDQLSGLLAKIDGIDRAECRSRVVSEFSSQRMARDYVNVYENRLQ